jgi:primary-amine oxidase
MHDHILNFKADIEICGSNNTMVKHIFEPIETTYPWSNVTKSTMHLARKEIKPGYLVMPSRGGGMYTTTPNNTNLGNSQEFGKFAYYLTKYVRPQCSCCSHTRHR